MYTPVYTRLDDTLPAVGTSVLMCNPVTPDAVAGVFAGTNVAALGAMRGYVRSYAGPSGGLIFAAAGALAAWALGWQWVAAGLFGTAGAMGWSVMEIRRRSRKWESVISARIAQLTA